ncbi:unnamed protein product [Rhizopus stolonifer]
MFSTKSVRYGQDYLADSLPSPLRIKRQPIVHTEIKPVSLKPKQQQQQFSIGGLFPTDTVSHLKQRIYQQQSAYPVQRQRLLVKGKVLNDTKKLSELGLQEGNIIHLMLTAAPKTGRWGISIEAEEKISEAGFWEAIKKTLVDQVGETDANILLSKVKTSLAV